jgi:hypothetical protein
MPHQLFPEVFAIFIDGAKVGTVNAATREEAEAAARELYADRLTPESRIYAEPMALERKPLTPAELLRHRARDRRRR